MDDEHVVHTYEYLQHTGFSKRPLGSLIWVSTGPVLILVIPTCFHRSEDLNSAGQELEKSSSDNAGHDFSACITEHFVYTKL